MAHEGSPFLSAIGRPLARRVRRQWLFIAVERLIAALALPAAVAGVAAAFILSDALPRLPGDWQAVALAAIASAVLASVLYGLSGFRWPTGHDAIRRLESGAAHRPLSALGDTPATADSPLWQHHREVMRQAALRLRPARPMPGRLIHDPYGLGVIPVLALTVALAAGWNDLGERWQRGIMVSAAVQTPVTAEMWITPPAYTGLAPVHVRSGEAEGTLSTVPEGTLSTVPEGSKLVLLVEGGHDGMAPVARMDGHALPLAALDEASRRAESVLTPTKGASILRVTAGGQTIAAWPLTVAVDQPPTVAFSATPGDAADMASGPQGTATAQKGDHRGQLAVPLVARDDFGLKRLSLAITLRDSHDTRRFDIPVGGPVGGDTAVRPTTELTETVPFDLAADAWAGLPVTLTLTAEDGKGQTATSASVAIDLPERHFKNPVAAALAAERRILVRHPGGEHRDVVGALDSLSRKPGAFHGDITVFLGLRVGAYRLAMVPGAASDADVAALLWSLALRIEDGAMGDAQQALDQAAKALDKALSDPKGDVQAATEQLRQALRDYMAAMAKQMGITPQASLPDASALKDLENNGMQSLDDDLQRLAGMAALGDKEAAKALRDRIRQQLEALRHVKPLSPEQLAAAAKIGKQIDDLVQQERGLLADTFAAEKSDGNGVTDQGMPTAADALTKPLTARQDAIRQKLDDLMADIGAQAGKVPDALGQAERAMHAVTDALSQGSLDGAAAGEGAAIQALSQGKRPAMASAYGGGSIVLLPGGGAEQFGPGGQGGSTPGPLGQEGRDPLGRATGGMVDSQGRPLPTTPDVNRARDLLDELRRRAGDPGRSVPERDYLQRLLDGL